MGPQRLDRREIRERLAPNHAGWITDELADAFEPAFLKFQRQVADAARKRKPKVDDEHRARLGRKADPHPEAGD